MKTFAIRLASSAFAIVAAYGVAPAFADDVAFSYSPGDLRSSQSVSSLYQRMEEEASRACAIYQNSGLFGVEYRRQCTSDLVDQFVADIGDGGLSALHDERHSRFADNR